jgi:phosphoribosylamine--glycine ligase
VTALSTGNSPDSSQADKENSMKVLVIGGGGREHAMVWKIRQSPRVSEVHCAPGNAGIAELARCVALSGKPPFRDIIEHCRKEKIDLVAVGPEAPLVVGLADALAAEKISCFGAAREAAQLEGSKAFTRDLLQEAGVPSHEWKTFESALAAQAYYRAKSEPWWIKADGLAAGKGAVLPRSIEEGCALLKNWLESGAMGEAGRRVVIEEPLRGPEVSVIAFAEGETVRPLVPSQDHKRLLNGDQGPNTGGMGAFAPTPTASHDLMKTVEEQFLLPTLQTLRKRGIEFRGMMYAGMLITERGPRLLEYNVRFGDPETQVILPLLDTDLVDVMEAVVQGRLSTVDVRMKADAAVTVVAAAEGYPQSPRKGDVIEGLHEADTVLGNDGVVFHAGTKHADGGIVTSGGRVLGVTGFGSQLGTARDRVYAALKKIRWPGMQYRSDIANGK